MKKLVFVFMLLLAMVWVGTSCQNTKPADGSPADSDTIIIEEVDSTIYGVCGDGTAMHTLELVTDGGDTLFYSLTSFAETETGEEEEVFANVQGGMMVGDRMAVKGHSSSEGLVAERVINLTTLLGKWTSLDKNFEIVEGGFVKSNVEAESNPWVSWKILNGRLLLNTDTFDIVELGADSLYIESTKGIFVYKRLQ